MGSIFIAIYIRRNMAIRKKKRGPSLDDKYLGPEPIFTEESEFTDSAWMNAAHWYNYFYKTKDYIPTTYQFSMDIFFFFNDTATTEIYTNLNTLSLHDALPI